MTNHAPATRPCRLPWSGLLRLAAVLACLLAAAACSEEREGPTITVTSARTPEDRLLGQVALVLLEEHGYPTADKTGLGEPRAVRAALVGARADLAWAYTGETWVDYLGHDHPITDVAALFAAVRDEDAAGGLTWIGPTPVERRLTLLVTPDLAGQARLSRVSQVPGYRSSVDPAMRLCAPEDLQGSPQGLRGLERVYGLRFAASSIVTASVPEGYDRLRAGQCDCALGYTNDAAVQLGQLQALADDQGFFAASSLALSVRREVLDAYPELEALLGECAGALTDAEMGTMLRQVVQQDVEARVAARSFVQRAGLLPGGEAK